MAKAAAQAQATAKNQPRLKKVYEETIRKALLEEFKYDNEMQVPRLDKIVLNMGVGEATGDSKKPAIAAEKPKITHLVCWRWTGPDTRR